MLTILMRTCLYSIQRPFWCACSMMRPGSRFSSSWYSTTFSPLMRTRQSLPFTINWSRYHFLRLYFRINGSFIPIERPGGIDRAFHVHGPESNDGGYRSFGRNRTPPFEKRAAAQVKLQVEIAIPLRSCPDGRFRARSLSHRVALWYKRAIYPKIEPEKWYLLQLIVKGKDCLVRINGENVVEYHELEESGPRTHHAAGAPERPLDRVQAGPASNCLT